MKWMRIVDLRSDTVTRPGPEMREAMARAEVGDDVYGEDPTVNRLQEVAAARLGKEAALLVPSGTMANQIALRVQTQHGDAVIAGEHAHLQLYEAGAAAALSGLQFLTAGSGGLFGAAELEAAILPADPHFPRARVVCVENTHNRSGGRVFPFEDVRAIGARAAERGLARHLDGARIFNAEIASGVAARDWAAQFDSVSFCLSKGLGAPIGSLLCGSRELVARAHRIRKQLGGGMRQAGVIAAAGLIALRKGPERLAGDHENAVRLANALAGLPGIDLDPATVRTNIVIVPLNAALGGGGIGGIGRIGGRAGEDGDLTAAFLARLGEHGVLASRFSRDRARFVTHRDVGRAEIDTAIARIRTALGA
jgi:threonine aldolase